LELSLKNKIYIFGVVLLLIVLFIFIKLPYSIKGPCYFSAQIEWSLGQTEPDKLLSRIINNDTNQIQGFTLLQFDRQDFVQFSLDASIRNGMWINKGQVVATISSTEDQLFLTDLRGQLRRTEANLLFLRTGEKIALQEEAIQALNYAKAELAAFKPQLDRRQKLFEQGLISHEEWEIATTTNELYQNNIALHEARLLAVQSGERTESLNLMEAELARIQQQIEGMQKKLSLGRLISPIDGLLTYHLEDSLICKVSKIDTLVIQIPVRAEERKYIKIGQIVKIYNPDTNLYFSGLVSKIASLPSLFNGQSMYLIKSIIANTERNFLPSMTGFARIHCDNISIWGHLQRAWNMYMGMKLI
jgi:hypothetical protein